MHLLQSIIRAFVIYNSLFLPLFTGIVTMKMARALLECLKEKVEIPLFLLYFCFMFSDAVTSNFIMYRTCYVTMGFSQSACALLGTNNASSETNDLEKKVQPNASVLLMTQSIFSSIIPALLCIFIGPWVDRNGRKPIIACVLLGNLITYLMLIVINSISSASPWWWLLTAFTTSFGGGESALLMACVCYISDITSKKNRGIRMGLFESSMSIGVLLGVASSSYAYNAFGYVFTYGICAALCSIALLYTIVLLPESIEVAPKQNRCSNLFKFSHLKQMYKTITKKRTKRSTLWILMAVLMLYMLAINADSQIIFLFLRDKFKMSLEEYTLFNTVNSALGIVVPLLQLYLLHRLCGFKETPITFIGLTMLTTSAILYGTVSTITGLYIAGAVKCLGGVTRPMLKSAISKVVMPEELGQVLTISTAVESLTPFVTGPIYNYVYRNTLYTYSASFNIITAGLLSITIIILCFLFCIKRNGQEN